MNLARTGTQRDEEHETDDPGNPMQTIVILAPPPVVQAAQTYFDYSVMFGLNVLSRQLQNMSIDTERTVPDFDADEYNRLRDAAVEAMHADLS